MTTAGSWATSSVRRWLIEGLLAFFLESTFLGLWIFGWDRLPKKLHLATIWLAAIGTVLSAYFILAANSFMQNPVGYEINPQTQRAEMTDIGQVLGQPLAIITFTHVITMAFLVSGLFVAGISAWLLFKGRSLDVVRSTLKLGSITALVAFVLTGITGDAQATKMVEVQPMKMAAAEALYETAAPARSASSRSVPSTGPSRSSASISPRPVAAGHAQLGRRGAGHQQPAGAVRGAVRPGTTGRTSRWPTGTSGSSGSGSVHSAP